MQLAQLAKLELHPNDLAGAAARCEQIAEELQGPWPDLARWLKRVVVHDSRLDLVISAQAVAEALQVPLAPGASPSLTRSCEARLTRTGRAVRLVQKNGALVSRTAPDPAVLRLLMKARHWWSILAQGEVDATTLAKREKVTDSYLIRVVRLAFLSPAVVEGILAGRLRSAIDAAALLKADAMPLDWEDQEKRLLSG
jgi:hypothetical protein